MQVKDHQVSTSSMDRAVPDAVIFNDWYVVAKSHDLSPGTVKGARLLDTDLVLWRAENSQVFAWEDRCPHRSVRLSSGRVEANTIVCSYHGMAYDANGQCVRVPAHPNYNPPKQACVRSFQVQECYGLVFVCLGEPVQEPSPFPEWGDSGFRQILCGPYHSQCGGYRAIENFLDLAHFPFIHTGILGDPNQTEIDEYQAAIRSDGVHLYDIRFWQPDAVGIGKGAWADYRYWTPRPLTAYFRKDTPDGSCLSILYFVTPVGEEESISWMCVAANYGDASQDQAIQEFQDKIVLQDLANLSTHVIKRLPLNIQTEFHVPFDLGSLTYRKWLRKLGVTYGVIY